MTLKRVWEPIRIGTVEVPNRIARAANTTTVVPSGIDDQFIAYHRARAEGGVGLSILEAASVHASSNLSYGIEEKTCAGFERLMKAVRPFGMRVFQQLWHGGHHVQGNGGRLPWAASDAPSPFTGIVGMPMGTAEIEELIAAFASAARMCRDAGLDGVEIHAGHGYLIQQFLSPLTNDREDAYGGSLENRMRFALEVFRAVRSAVGPDFPVGARMSTSTAPGNITAVELGELASRLQRESLISFLDASHGDYFEKERMTATMAEVAGYELIPNEPLLSAVSVPRLVTGRFRTLEEAEQILRTGIADLVSLVRAQIADSDLVRKTREGRVEQVRPCIACNQGCVGGLLRSGRMACAVNPAAGLESTLAESLIVAAARRKKVLIVGAGPAGLEAARVAAMRGHRVVLVEADARLGGSLRIARRASRLQAIGDIADWLEREVVRLGVEIRTGIYMEAEEVLEEQPDVLIIATGAAPRTDGVQAAVPGLRPCGCALPHVTTAEGLLGERERAASLRSALVLDDVGHYEAVAAAEELVGRGAAVIYVTGLSSFAPGMDGTFRNEAALKYLHRGSFRLLVGHCLVAIESQRCLVRPLSGERTETVPADTVVLVTHRAPRRALFDQLRHRIAQVRLIGDAASPRTLQDAIREGHLAARSD